MASCPAVASCPVVLIGFRSRPLAAISSVPPSRIAYDHCWRGLVCVRFIPTKQGIGNGHHTGRLAGDDDLQRNFDCGLPIGRGKPVELLPVGLPVFAPRPAGLVRRIAAVSNC